MKSIRLSLLVYFLVLLSAALGTVSVLLYRTAQETLADKNRATKELIERQYQEMRAKERARLDAALLADAKAAYWLTTRTEIRMWNPSTLDSELGSHTDSEAQTKCTAESDPTLSAVRSARSPLRGSSRRLFGRCSL